MAQKRKHGTQLELEGMERPKRVKREIAYVTTILSGPDFGNSIMVYRAKQQEEKERKEGKEGKAEGDLGW